MQKSAEFVIQHFIMKMMYLLITKEKQARINYFVPLARYYGKAARVIGSLL